ncbi:MAG: cupredoxin domain-containing protein [Candidatus Limnocylindria bacterium]
MQRIRFGIVGLALVAVLAACGTASGAPTSDVDPADADLTITSSAMAFDTDTLTVPAGEAFTLAYANTEAMPHNVAIYTDESASDALFAGEEIETSTIVYEIPALEPGEYFFRCDLHPDMAGTVIVE